MKRLTLLAGCLAVMTLLVQAQDIPQIQPKPVKPVAPAQPPPKVPEPKAPKDSEVLLTKLKGLVFVSTPRQVVKSGLKSKGIDVKKIPVPEPSDFTTLASAYLGKKLTRGDLNLLIKDIILFYRKHDRPLVDVIVPEQDIATGTVQLVVLEGHAGKVTTSGNRWFSDREIRDGVPLKTGDSIRESQLRSDLDWLNSNPFHTTDVIYRPGTELGETDLVLKTKDRFPARLYAGYENNGNATTGFDRYEAGLNWGDAFQLGLDQQLNYQYTTSGDGQSLRAHAGSYVIPLPWRHTVTFYGSYTDSKGAIPPLIGIKGRSYQISGRYSIPLPELRTEEVSYKQNVSAGFDYKYNDNALEFGNVPAGGTLYDIDQFAFGYHGALADPYGQTTLDEQLFYSPGNWGGHNNDAAFGASHTLASSDYVYSTLSLERLTRLPDDWSLLLRATLQESNGNLPPSEQLGFGGEGSVRGYDDREVNTDEGYVFTTELRTPPVSVGNLLRHPEFHDQLQFLGFWDYGAGYNHTLLPGEADETPLSSVGAGLLYNLGTYVSVRFDYGFQLLSTHLDNQQGSREDIGVTVSY